MSFALQNLIQSHSMPRGETHYLTGKGTAFNQDMQINITKSIKETI